MYRNLVFFFLIFSNSGYWKSHNEHDFSSFDFKYSFLALYIVGSSYSWHNQKFEKRVESGLPVFFPFQQFYFIYKKIGNFLEFLFFSSINSSKLEKTG
jgi:hypothetical protein